MAFGDDVVARKLASIGAPSVGKPPLTVQQGQYGFVQPVWGRPPGLGVTPAVGDANLASTGPDGDCDCGCGGSGSCSRDDINGPDIFLRGPAVGVSDDSLAIIRRRGG